MGGKNRRRGVRNGAKYGLVAEVFGPPASVGTKSASEEEMRRIAVKYATDAGSVKPFLRLANNSAG